MTFVTQLYKTGVYGIVNNNPATQASYTPKAIVKIEKKLQKAVDKGELKELKLGLPIIVTDKSGFWEELLP